MRASFKETGAASVGSRNECFIRSLLFNTQTTAEFMGVSFFFFFHVDTLKKPFLSVTASLITVTMETTK